MELKAAHLVGPEPQQRASSRGVHVKRDHAVGCGGRHPGRWQSRGGAARMPGVSLAGDVGGTKTHLALYRPGDAARSPAVDRKLPSRDHASLDALIREFLAATGGQPRHVVLGIAGPVVGNRADTTNLPWSVDGAALGQALGGARVTLLNDLTAAAWGLGVLGSDDFEVIQPGLPTPRNRGLVAAG